MVAITLPDGSLKNYDGSVTGQQIAQDISTSLAKVAVLVRVNGTLLDLTRPITQDSAIEVITRKSEETLALLRHDCAHVLAQAVQELFPKTQITFGPATKDGFYYDFYRKAPFSTDDFAIIEERMHEIVNRNTPIIREVWTKEKATAYFKEHKETFKAQWVQQLPDNEDLTIYRQGDWLDLCRGPHLPTTKGIGHAFKLMKLAGAYWRGDANNPQLQRIYGTCWQTDKELKSYLKRLEEAEKRDHRKIGKALDLFHLQPEIGQGMVFWHPKGWQVWLTCEHYIRERLKAHGYQEIKTPQLLDRVLWEKSGHWEKFRSDMFVAEVEEEGQGHDRKVYALKPMSCPGHVEVFNQGIKSYRDLPLRYAEFGACHRNEPSGSLHGIMRVRALTQDDGHIFCTPEQIVSETQKFSDMLKSVYEDFGFHDIRVQISDRPEVRAGSDATWDRAEQALITATKAVGLDYTINTGEGAFYGPKLEFVLTDSIGREWQCGTLQVDFVLPERLEASYVGEDGEKHRPVMLHRAILGSLERFIGVLIEHHEGRFPLWLAPIQVVIATITNEADDYAQEVLAACQKAGLRAEIDLKNAKINYKVREHSLQKVPFIFVVGRNEAQERTVAIRRLGGKSQEILKLRDALTRLQQDVRIPSLEQ